MDVYAVLCCWRPLSVSTTSTISLLTAQALADTGAADDAQRALSVATALALMTGILLFLGGVVRLRQSAESSAYVIEQPAFGARVAFPDAASLDVDQDP